MSNKPKPIPASNFDTETLNSLKDNLQQLEFTMNSVRQIVSQEGVDPQLIVDQIRSILNIQITSSPYHQIQYMNQNENIMYTNGKSMDIESINNVAVNQMDSDHYDDQELILDDFENEGNGKIDNRKRSEQLNMEKIVTHSGSNNDINE